MSEKSATKTAKPSPRSGVSLPLGNHPGNTGGKKGRSGRKPGWFKEFSREVLADPKVQAAIKARAEDATAHGFWQGVETLGKAAGEIVPTVKADIKATVVFKAVRE